VGLGERIARSPAQIAAKNAVDLDDRCSPDGLCELIKCVLLPGSPGAASGLWLDTTGVTERRVRDFNEGIIAADRKPANLANSPSFASRLIGLGWPVGLILCRTAWGVHFVGPRLRW